MAGVIVALVVHVRNVGRDNTKDSVDVATSLERLSTNTEHISNDIKNIKADNRRWSMEINEAKIVANNAILRAEAAHERLDAMNAPSAGYARHTKGDAQ